MVIAFEPVKKLKVLESTILPSEAQSRWWNQLLGKLSEVECVYCGQCSVRCPTAALIVKSEVDKAWEAVLDPEKFVVAQIAPAVRVAVGEALIRTGRDQYWKNCCCLEN